MISQSRQDFKKLTGYKKPPEKTYPRIIFSHKPQFLCLAAIVSFWPKLLRAGEFAHGLLMMAGRVCLHGCSVDDEFACDATNLSPHVAGLVMWLVRPRHGTLSSKSMVSMCSKTWKLS